VNSATITLNEMLKKPSWRGPLTSETIRIAKRK